MNQKDWILLLVPIFFNGALLFVLQKVFERRQITFNKKYEYVSKMQRMIDYALSLFINMLKETGNDLNQIDFLERYIKSYCDVFYYYQQNQKIFVYLKKYMDEMFQIHHSIEVGEYRSQISEERNMESHLRDIFEILQTMQDLCIKCKI